MDTYTFHTFSPSFQALQNVFCSHFLIFCLLILFFMFILNSRCSCFLLKDQEAKGLMPRKWLSLDRRMGGEKQIVKRHTSEGHSKGFLRGWLARAEVQLTVINSTMFSLLAFPPPSSHFSNSLTFLSLLSNELPVIKVLDQAWFWGWIGFEET